VRIIAIVLFLLSVLHGQAGKATPAPTPTLSDSQKVALYTLQHQLDQAQMRMTELNNDYLKLQAQIEQMKKEYEILAAQRASLYAALEQKKGETLKAGGFDSAKFEITPNFEIKEKEGKK
jgi:predicted RNase H-like nuclease (RuvC/YqgF family)